METGTSPKFAGISAADARKMKMMDPMGHKMTRMSMSGAKKMGYKMAKAGGAEMGHPKMGGDKMGGGRM